MGSFVTLTRPVAGAIAEPLPTYLLLQFLLQLLSASIRFLLSLIITSATF